MKNILIFLLLFLIIPFKYGYSQEEIKKNPILTDKFQFNVGIIIPSKIVKIGADVSSPSDNIDFGKTFNFNDNEITPYVKFDWLFAKKWKLSAEYFTITNANKAELKEDIIWDNVTFKKGSFVRGGFGYNMCRIYVGRVFSQGFKHEFGGGLGVHALNTYAFIEGNIEINENETRFEKRNVRSLIPLPNIGVWYYYTPNIKWAMIAKIDWFAINIDEYSAGLWDISAGIKYQIFKNFGMGIDYKYFDVNLGVNKSSWKGNIDMRFHGPLFTIHANF